ncbi:CCA tRNA nucleotidyltransferase [Neobacillus mesonae]|uniref:CCA tRNA nucleotidyltransferase n=1 Tax=Neobacillus mesonae TaxID=1193713 RepID=UPI00203B6E1A|nr:CCA tRNA nucleotidyltransferase [Neobacillus mesonae]MCM3566810.1 CCA tRNA nucleotidyltransferase [Neobacillus mesonae]
MKEPFLSAVPVLKQLEDAGFEAYFVGGSVRDYLLNKKISDVDIATSATPMEVKSIFSKTVDIGIEHGTVLVLTGGNSYEITTFRSEGKYEDFRRPTEVSFIRSLTEDLRRRDFTINAIAMDRTGKLADPFDGQLALKERLIQSVGNAEERFSEDALRMMRAVRFVSQLSFHIEENTQAALKELAPLLENIAVERKRAEFEKLITGRDWKAAIKIILETKIYSYLPGLNNRKAQIESLLSYDCENLTKIEMWALLIFSLKLSQQDIESFLRDWRLPVKEIKLIQKILSHLEIRLQRDWSVYDLYLAGNEVIASVEKLFLVIKGVHEPERISGLMNRYDSLPIKDSREAAVKGSDLIEWFNLSGGPWLKDTLMKIEQAILERKVLNDKQKIKEWLKECSQN